jgi:hypothetical protein
LTFATFTHHDAYPGAFARQGFSANFCTLRPVTILKDNTSLPGGKLFCIGLSSQKYTVFLGMTMRRMS